MKIPESPPPLDEAIQHLGELHDATRLLFDARRDLMLQQRYLHWDDLRYRDPPEGLTRWSWWARLKLQRIAAARMLPDLCDVEDRPFYLVTTPSIERTLHRVDQAIAGGVEVPGRRDIRATGDRYLISSIMEEAITSSQLEGASTTRRVAKRMLREGRAPRTPDERMIWNNYHALQLARERLDRPLDLPLLLEIHARVTEGTLEEPAYAGRLRDTDDIQVVYRPEGVVLHQPPPARSLEERLQRLFAFAARGPEDGPFLHPVLRAIAVHFQLAYEHPFVDGNGRVARILFYATLLRAGYWLAEYLSVSRILKDAPQQYARAFLLTETDGGDLTYFIVHQLGVLDRAIDELHTFIERRSRKSRDARKLARSLDGVNSRQIALLDHAIRHPDASYEIAVHQGYHAISYPTARADLLALADRGLLVHRKVGRKLVFFVADDLDRRLHGRGTDARP